MSEHKTKEEILTHMRSEMPWEISLRTFPYISEAMQLYADQQTSSLTQQLADKIKAEFTDDWIKRQLLTKLEVIQCMWMRDEILKLIETHKTM